MKKSGLQTFRVIIFFLGLLIIFAAGVLLHKEETDISWQEVYILITAIITYIVIFIPSILPLGDYDKSGGLFVAGAVYYRGAIGYLLSSIALISLVTKMHIALAHAVISELVAILVFIAYVYFACLVSSKVTEVAHSESSKRYGVDQLRKVASRLLVEAEGLGIEHQSIKRRIGKIAEDMRYLSPSDDREAIALEDRMIAIIRDMISDPYFKNAGNTGVEHINKNLDEIEATIKMRKGIY